MKKLMNLSLCLVVLTGFVSCGDSGGGGKKATPQASNPPPQNETESPDTSSVSSRVLKTHKCYADEEATSVTNMIKKEKPQGKPSTYFLYDCKDPKNCSQQFELTKTAPTEAELGTLCFQHATNPELFSVCAEGEIIVDAEEDSWSFTQLIGTRGPENITMVCDYMEGTR